MGGYAMGALAFAFALEFAFFLLFFFLLFFLNILFPGLAYSYACMPLFLLFGIFVLLWPFYFISIAFGRNLSRFHSFMRLWFNASVSVSYTKKAIEHREKWLQYARFIRNYSELEEKPAKYHELWCEHYTYALAVGAVEDSPNTGKSPEDYGEEQG